MSAIISFSMVKTPFTQMKLPEAVTAAAIRVFPPSTPHRFSEIINTEKESCRKWMICGVASSSSGKS